MFVYMWIKRKRKKEREGVCEKEKSGEKARRKKGSNVSTNTIFFVRALRKKENNKIILNICFLFFQKMHISKTVFYSQPFSSQLISFLLLATVLFAVDFLDLFLAVLGAVVLLGTVLTDAAPFIAVVLEVTVAVVQGAVFAAVEAAEVLV